MLLNGATARIGACVEGTRLCETINSLFGIRKLGSACDAGMLESDCVPVLSYKSGSIGLGQSRSSSFVRCKRNCFRMRSTFDR